MEKRENNNRVPDAWDLYDLLGRKCAPDYVFRQLAEECAELAQAALKLIRALENRTTYKVDRDAAVRNFIEEMADVGVMWDITRERMWLDADCEMLRVMAAKRKRMRERLEALPDRAKPEMWTVELPHAETDSKCDTMDETQAAIHGCAAGIHFDAAKILAFINDYFRDVNK